MTSQSTPTLTQIVHDQLRNRIWVALKNKLPLSIEDFEDVWSETSTKIFKMTKSEGLPPFSNSDQLFGFIYRIAHNAAVDVLRKAKKEKDQTVHPENLEILADVRRQVSAPSDVCITQETFEIVFDEIARLEPDERLVLEVSIENSSPLYPAVRRAYAARGWECPPPRRIYYLHDKARAVLLARLRFRGVIEGHE